MKKSVKDKSGSRKKKQPRPARTGREQARDHRPPAAGYRKKTADEARPPLEKPDLLAPAGSPATWAAALEAGADAVYLGMREFSARAFAANFTLNDVARTVDLTHERGKKIFIAFNTILKEKELPQAGRMLDALARIKPDALIVQDLGLYRMIRKYYPQFEVHASTLMAAHNLAGLQVLAGMGYDRAVLARELTLREIEDLALRSPIPVEIFIHGALCFSFSGLCLMSSFLGGKGSLRGACTQPCRRIYTSGRKRGSFFSPTDLDATTVMRRIRRIPVKTLKIEGRMKGAEYVYRVVRAYRLLLDTPLDDLEPAVDEARNLIEGAPGRTRTTGFFTTAAPADVLAPNQATTSGIFLGKIQTGTPGGGRMVLQSPVETGDRLRVQFRRDGERQAFTLRKMTAGGRELSAADADDEVVLAAEFPLDAGDLVFKVDSGQGEKDALASPLMKALQTGRPGSFPDPKPGPVLKNLLMDLEQGRKPGPAGPAARGRKPESWFRIARAEDVSGIAQAGPGRIILPVTAANVRRMGGLHRRLGHIFNKIIWALPPLVFDTGLAPLKRDLAQLARMGVRDFMISSLSHLPLVSGFVQGRKGKSRIFADHRLNCLNTMTEAALADLGVAGVTISLETDEENLQDILSRPGPVDRIFYIYGRPPLFTSRFRPVNLKDNLPVESPKQERFRIRQEQDNFLMFAEKPVYFSPIFKFRSLGGIQAFIVDLEFDPRPLATVRDIGDAISRKRPMGNTTRFNFSRGLF